VCSNLPCSLKFNCIRDDHRTLLFQGRDGPTNRALQSSAPKAESHSQPAIAALCIQTLADQCGAVRWRKALRVRLSVDERIRSSIMPRYANGPFRCTMDMLKHSHAKKLTIRNSPETYAFFTTVANAWQLAFVLKQDTCHLARFRTSRYICWGFLRHPAAIDRGMQFFTRRLSPYGDDRQELARGASHFVLHLRLAWLAYETASFARP
jgi:hypothetical protein